MNYEPNNTIISLMMVTLSLLILSLTGCGGGGGKTDNSVSTTSQNTPLVTVSDTSQVVVDYSPEEERLTTEASSSSELYVEPTFNFDSFKVIDVDISARDVASDPLSGALVSISVIDDSISDLNDVLINEKSLLTNVFTDNNGQINITLEVPDSVNKLLLEIHALGIENKVIFNVDEAALVMHNF
ncbi:MAG: hypothetical protein P8I03_07415 [Thalassotalea sp.]|nr:hypothetical protein [Thalassotalea sp.]